MIPNPFAADDIALSILLDPAGWLVGVQQCPSPNFNARPEAEVSLLVVHNISLPPREFGGGFIEDFFCNRLHAAAHPYFAHISALQVSAHCLIDRNGRITQFVSFAERAWHAGQSEYQGRANCNDFSVGIELEGADDVPYTDAQYNSLCTVASLLLQQYPKLTVERVVGHCDIAPTRKTDPGPAFDWPRFRASLRLPRP